MNKKKVLNFPDKIFEAKTLLIFYFGLSVNYSPEIDKMNFQFIHDICNQESFCTIAKRVAMTIRRFEIQRIKIKYPTGGYPPEILDCSEFKDAMNEMMKLFEDFKTKKETT